MSYRMADPEFLAEQWEGRFREHVAPINDLIDALGSENQSWAPYVAPHQGGVAARLLSLSSNPGPKTRAGDGSGFISCENADPSAKRMCELYEASGISQNDTLPWNAWPLYVHDELRGKVTAKLRQAGVDPLIRLLARTPEVRVVILHGGDAQDTWTRLTKAYGSTLRARRIVAIPTWHTGNLAMATNGHQRKNELAAAYVEATAILRN